MPKPKCIFYNKLKLFLFFWLIFCWWNWPQIGDTIYLITQHNIKKILVGNFPMGINVVSKLFGHGPIDGLICMDKPKDVC
jgi:hypothetical protein